MKSVGPILVLCLIGMPGEVRMLDDAFQTVLDMVLARVGGGFTYQTTQPTLKERLQY